MALGVLKPKLVLRGVQVSQKKPALVLRARRWPLAGDGSDAVRAQEQNLCQQSSLWQDVCELHSHGLWKHADTGGESHPPQRCTHVTESLSLPQIDQSVTWNILATILHQYVKCESKLFSFTTLLTPKAWDFFTLNSIQF